jgi:hypothetical protein
MNYTKPEVVLSGSALHAIQSGEKGAFSVKDNTNPADIRKTNGAYEADE